MFQDKIRVGKETMTKKSGEDHHPEKGVGPPPLAKTTKSANTTKSNLTDDAISLLHIND